MDQIIHDRKEKSDKSNGLNTYAYFRYIISQLPSIYTKNKTALLELLSNLLDSSILHKYLS